MDNSKTIQLCLVVLIAILNSVCYSQMEIVINGNVVIEQINNNENGVASSATVQPSSASPSITSTNKTPSTTLSISTTTTTTKTTTKTPTKLINLKAMLPTTTTSTTKTAGKSKS